MDFYVNGNKIDIKLENEKTIGDVLRAFEEECAKNNATTISIFVDNEQVRADTFDEIAAKALADGAVKTIADRISIRQSNVVKNRFIIESSPHFLMNLLYQNNHYSRYIDN